MAPEISFTLESAGRAREVRNELASRFRTRRDGRSGAARTYYDTFDWRLYRDGGWFAADPDGDRWLLRWERLDGSGRHRSSAETVPGFAREIGTEAFREDLDRVIDMRRLLPVVRVDSRRETVAVLDHRDKTVARVHLERSSASATNGGPPARPMARLVRVAPVLGYEQAQEEVAGHLQRSLGLERCEGGELSLALDAVGMLPGAYSSKIDVPLDASMRTDEAVGRILRALFDVTRANEDGTRRDLDSEFLHDFRVSVRRTRSCLGQVREVFDPRAVERFRREFAWLGQLTGATRDLDVYLLKMRDYRDELTESLRPGLDGLESYLRRRQRVEQRRLARGLDSRRYERLVRDWTAFLGQPPREQPGGGPSNAARPVREVASHCIRRAFRRVCKRGRGLAPTTPVERVHRLRIDCKKLRYLLEFFRNAFDAERLAPLLRSLKGLQDDLGDFNDLTVQQRELRAMAAEMLERSAAGTETLLAMGCLVGHLEQRQTELKSRVVDGVCAFVSDAARERFGELFG